MIEAVWIVMVVIVVFLTGVMFGAETSVNRPKKNELPKFDKMSNTGLLVLFMAAGEEMERRGMVERINVTPFDELKK
jgi:hypothetical protein